MVTQRTEILAGTLAENIALFADVAARATSRRRSRELGLDDWVAGLPDGLDTLLGPGGTSLSAGEEQLVAFARLLVRDVQVVVLDEATARMDPLTEARVVAAADRLLAGRTGILIAHRLSTIERAPHVAVLDHGRVVQHGPRAALAPDAGAVPRPAGGQPRPSDARLARDGRAERLSTDVPTLDRRRASGRRRRGSRRSASPPDDPPSVGTGPSLAARGSCTRCSCARSGASRVRCCSCSPRCRSR